MFVNIPANTGILLGRRQAIRYKKRHMQSILPMWIWYSHTFPEESKWNGETETNIITAKLKLRSSDRERKTHASILYQFFYGKKGHKKKECESFVNCKHPESSSSQEPEAKLLKLDLTIERHCFPSFGFPPHLAWEFSEVIIATLINKCPRWIIPLKSICINLKRSLINCFVWGIAMYTSSYYNHQK